MGEEQTGSSSATEASRWQKVYRWYRDAVRNHPLLTLISSLLAGVIFLATLYSSVQTIYEASRLAISQASSNPYSDAYENLASIDPGVSLGFVRGQFGEPLIDRPLSSSDPTFRSYSEWIYSEAGYFLKVFADSDGVVADIQFC
jgi:hypothetical protein